MKPDRLQKLSLKEYIDQERESGTRYEGLDKIIKLQTLGIEIKMEDLYRRTKLISSD